MNIEKEIDFGIDSHETSRIIIKTADVDVKIIPLINWLNSFEAVTTRYCCQGAGAEDVKNKDEVSSRMAKDMYRPHVIFYCSDQLSLACICRRAFSYANITVEWYEGSIRYNMKFVSQESLLDMIKYININANYMQNEDFIKI